MNNKDKLIDRVPSLTDEQKQQAKDFFKKYSNYENKIDWNKIKTLTWKDFEEVFELAKQSKSAKKSDLRSLFNDSNFRIINEDDNFIYVAPLNWDAAKFMDSYQCGGQGAKWCIGWSEDKRYWNSYTRRDEDAFVLIMTKPNAQTTLYETFANRETPIILPERLTDLSDYTNRESENFAENEGVIRRALRKRPRTANLEKMDKTDNKAMCQIHADGRVNVWSQVKDRQILEEVTFDELLSYGFDIPRDCYEDIRDAMSEFKSTQYGIDDVRARALVGGLSYYWDIEVESVALVNDESHTYVADGNNYFVLTLEEAYDRAIAVLKGLIVGEEGNDWDALPGRKFPWECVNHNCFDDWVRDDYRSRWDDMSDEEKIDELLRLNTRFGDYCCEVCECEEFFEVGEDGDVDISKPLFNFEDYEDDYVDSWGYEYASSLDYVFDMFGEAECKSYIPFEALDFDEYIRWYDRNMDGDFYTAVLDNYSLSDTSFVGKDGHTYHIYQIS